MKKRLHKNFIYYELIYGNENADIFLKRKNKFTKIGSCHSSCIKELKQNFYERAASLVVFSKELNNILMPDEKPVCIRCNRCHMSHIQCDCRV